MTAVVDFSYDPLNRIMRVEYVGETGYKTPNVDYTYDEARPDPVLGTVYNNGRLTTVATQGVSVTGGQFTPRTIQKYDYDKVGQVVNHQQTIDQQNYNLQYGYNLAGQLTSEKYPSGKVVNMTVDNFGVTQTIADSERTYVAGVAATYDANGMSSQVTLGNGTTETFRLNERFQMTSQSLKRGTEVLQKFDYAYGQTNAAGEITPGSNNGQLAKIEAFIGAAKQRTQKFTYDSIGRLSKSEEYRGDTNALTYKQVFDFDRFGNLYRKAGSNPTSGQENPIPFIAIEETSTLEPVTSIKRPTGSAQGRITTTREMSPLTTSFGPRASLTMQTGELLKRRRRTRRMLTRFMMRLAIVSRRRLTTSGST